MRLLLLKALINWFAGEGTVVRFKEKEQSSASARKKRKKGGQDLKPCGGWILTKDSSGSLWIKFAWHYLPYISSGWKIFEVVIVAEG